MNFESRHQHLAPLPVFLARSIRYALFAGGLVTASVAIGVFGYHQIAGLGWLDSFHMACMILTGMGPVAEMATPAAKLFSSFYALYSGVAFLSVSALLFAPLVHRLFHILHLDSGR